MRITPLFYILAQRDQNMFGTVKHQWSFGAHVKPVQYTKCTAVCVPYCRIKLNGTITSFLRESVMFLLPTKPITNLQINCSILNVCILPNKYNTVQYKIPNTEANSAVMWQKQKGERKKKRKRTEQQAKIAVKALFWLSLLLQGETEYERSSHLIKNSLYISISMLSTTPFSHKLNGRWLHPLGKEGNSDEQANEQKDYLDKLEI